MGARKDLALRSIRRKFEQWRSSRRSGEEIPASLWDDVHALESEFGRTNLAKVLGLNSSDMAFQMNLRGGSVASAVMPSESPSLAAAASPRALSSPPTVAITKVVSVPFEKGGALAGVVAEVQSPSGWVLRLRSDAALDVLVSFIEATGRAGGRP